MSRGSMKDVRRPLAVWLAATAGSAIAGALAWSPAAAVTGSWSDVTFADALVRVSALVLVLAVARLWVVTTLTIGGLLRGRVDHEARGTTRRLVLLACGAALTATATVPAAATESDRALLSGLGLPDRAVSVAPQATHAPSVRPTGSSAPTAHPVHVVATGDSLWSIAAAASPVGSDIDAAWRAIWAANRDVVGDDPHLILPGQRLQLPAAPPTTGRTAHESTHESTDETGDRP